MRQTHPPTNRSLLRRLIIVVVIAEAAAIAVTRYGLDWSWPFVIWTSCTGAAAIVLGIYLRQRR